MRDHCHGGWTKTRQLVCNQHILRVPPPAPLYLSSFYSKFKCHLLSPFRVVHSPPGRYPSTVTKTRWTSDLEVSQQKPGRHRRHQTYLQPYHQTQHCAGSLRGHRWDDSCRLAKNKTVIWWIKPGSKCSFTAFCTITRQCLASFMQSGILIHLLSSLFPVRQQVLLRSFYVGQRWSDLWADGTHSLRSENVRPNPSNRFIHSFLFLRTSC